MVLAENDVDIEDKHLTLPIPVWDRLTAETTYPLSKTYPTEQEALDDFRHAYNKAVSDGWDEVSIHEIGCTDNS